MSTYRVLVRQEYRITVEVEADDQEEAEEKGTNWVLTTDLAVLDDHASMEWADARGEVDAVKVDDVWTFVPPF